ncbi:P03 [Xanthomonas phage phiL7]|uniref:p03 n=1 Tax=Xanthomonas phage phiL7 TaxID=538979 RepID=C4ML03_9CAUD|nr:terminase large subunit [Xanthomonas phage phiL7]ACE75743.1 P03 [Xanthomonas phage phiL7]
MTPEYTTSMPDWESRLEHGLSIVPKPIFPDQAEVALGVFKRLVAVDVPGSPTYGEISPPWVFDFVAAVFGAYNIETGERLIKEFFCMVPKKSGKSAIASGIMLTFLILNWRKSAQFIIVSPTIQVADNSFKPSMDSVRADPQLSQLIQVSAHTRTLTHRVTGATLKVLAADGDTVTGSKASVMLADETHVLGTKPQAAQMLREAMGGLAARPEGCIIKISTQSSQPPAGVFKEDLQLFRDIRDGVVVDKRRFGVLYEHPRAWIEDGRARTLQGMKIVNPSLGYSVDYNFLEDQFQRAERIGGEQFLDFMSKHANLEIGLNLASDRFAGAAFWEQNADASLTLDTLIERCDVAVVGIDGGGLDDMLGLSVVGRCKLTRKWLSWSHAWVHTIALERRKDIASRLRDFEKDGDLTIVPLPGEDVQQLCEYVQRLESSGLLPEKNAIGVDPAGITAIVDMLTGDEYGIAIERIVAVSQGYRLSGAIKTLERALAGGTLVHSKQPLMDWCLGNAKIEVKGSAVYVTKAASGTAKIDPLAALFNAVSLIALNPSGRGTLDGWLSSLKNN